MMDNFLQFRFVPSMRCNLRCSYCFLKHSKGDEPTMFDQHSVREWVESMKQFSDHNVEFYMWGGEPFCLDDTFDLVKGLSEYEFVSWARIDHNMTAAKKIVNRCPNKKVKLNCSWHTETFALDQFWDLVLPLQEQGMVGMVNLVASDKTMAYLKENNLNLDDLVKKFNDVGIFFNVAADFQKGSDPVYREMILKYTCEDDWKYIHGEYSPAGTVCTAGENFFTVDIANGDLTSCGRVRSGEDGKVHPVVCGNYFSGELDPVADITCAQKSCCSIISYCHQKRNNFSYQRHLCDYVERNRLHRKNNGIV